MTLTDADRILLFIPAYNCGRQIGRVIAQLAKPVGRHVAEVLVLDNGSTDDTVDAAVSAARRLRSLDVPTPEVVIGRNAENYGLGGSHKAAYRYAAAQGFTHVITLHGDDQGDLEDLGQVLDRGLHRTADAWMGARFRRGARLEGYSLFRIVGNVVFNVFFSIAARHRVTDMGSGLNLVSRAAFDDPIVLRHPDGLHFNPRLLMGMYDGKRRVRYFPISWREDDQVSNVKMASQAIDTFKVAFDYLVARKRFRVEDHRTVVREEYPFDVVVTSAEV